MKAALIEKPGMVCVREIAEPVMGEYDALCEILFGATCPGTDLHLIEGKHPRPVRFPTVLGHESVGRVMKIGSKVRNYKIGDLVTRVGCPPAEQQGYFSNWGGFAEYGIARDHMAMQSAGLDESLWGKSRVNMVFPDSIPPQDATMIITWRETLSYFTLLTCQRRGSLLVLGSGSNALAYAVHAANAGFSPITVVGSPRRSEVFLAAAGGTYIDYNNAQYVEQVMEASEGGYDYIIDAIGKNGLLDSVIRTLKPGGTIGIYGWDDYFSNSIRPLAGSGSFFFYNGGYDENEVHDKVVTLILAGKLKSAYWFGKIPPFSLEDIQSAYEAVRRRNAIKTVVRVKSSG